MTLEQTLAGWTGPSSPTEQEKQERTERMIRDAVRNHAPFDGCSLSVYAKGSYANNTNVRADSDVDIAVQCHDVVYPEQASSSVPAPGTPYRGVWTPEKLRTELGAALRAKFPGQVDSSGSTAFMVNSSTARVDADVVPCFDYRYHFSSGGSRNGAKIFKKDGDSFINYPAQQLENGRSKNTVTNTRYKKAVRVLKRVENAMVDASAHREVASFLVECLVYNCPNRLLVQPTWVEVVRGVLQYVWNELQGTEPSAKSERWFEVNECKFLFHPWQDWSRSDARDFARAAWNYLGYSS